MKIPRLLGAFLVFVVVFLVFRGRPNMFATLTRREGMVNKTCPDGTRTDGPCLLEFPSV